MKRYLSTLVIIMVIVGLLLTGCGSTTEQTTEKQTTTQEVKTVTETTAPVTNKAEDVKGEVVFWGWYGDGYKPVFEDFEKNYPNVKINWVNVDGKDYVQKYTTALAAGTDLPDLHSLEIGWRKTIMDMGNLENLEAAQYNLDTKLMSPYQFPVIKDKDGKIVSVEMEATPGGLSVNTEAAKQWLGTDNLDEIESMLSTWDKVIQKGAEINQKSGGKEFLFASAGDLVDILTGQISKPIFDENTGKYDKDIIQNTLSVVKKAFDNKVFDYQVGPWSPSWFAAMADNKHIIFEGTTWFPYYALKSGDKDKWNTRWKFIKSPEGGCIRGGTALAIDKSSDVKEAAWAYIYHTCLTEQGAAVKRDKVGVVAAYQPALDNKDFFKPQEIWYGNQADFFQRINDTMKTMNVKPLSRFDSIWGNSFNLGVNAIIKGESLESALNTVFKDLDENIAKALE